MFDSPEQARALGRKAGLRSGQVRRKRLTLADVETAMPPLTDIESAMARLDRIGTWALAGMVAGTVANATVRSVEVWLKGNESKLTREVVGDLRARLEELEAEVKRPRLGRVP